MNATLSGPSRHLFGLPLPGLRTVLTLLVFALAAIAAPAQFTYSGSAVDTGASLVGQAINAGSLSINKPSGATVITAVTFTSDGAVNGEFGANSNTCTGTVTGPGTCTVSLNFTPKQTGLRRGALTISSIGNAPLVIYLHGVGQGSQLVFAPDAASAISTVTPLSPIYYSPTSSVYDGAGNLYFNDILNSRVLKQDATGTLSTVLSLPGNIMSALAISPTGTVFVSVPTMSAVYAITPGGTAAPITLTGVTLSQPTGLAVDGLGNLYIADAQNRRIVRSAFNGSSAVVLPLTGLAAALSSPEGLTVDATGNLYIADMGNQRIVKVVLATGVAAPFAITGQLLYNSYGLTTDASGAIYLADTGNRRILRITPAGAASAVLTPGFAFSSPTGVTLAANGDIIVADNNVGLTRIIRSTPSSPLTFSTPTPVNSQDTADGSRVITLQNIGNTALSFTVPVGSASNPSSSNSAFQTQTTSTCPILTSASASSQLASGAACTYAVNFTPSVVGANTGTLVISQMPTGSATSTSQSFALSGTGLGTLDAFNIFPASSTAATGVPQSFTVTALSGGQVSTPYRGTVALSSSDATATFPGGATYTFTAADNGTHTFTAPASGVTFNTAGRATLTVRDGSISATSSGITVRQTQTTPSISLTAAPNPVAVGSPVTLTATLTSGVANGPVPTGTVTFFDGATSLGSAPLINGKATLAPSLSASGTHSLTAVYNGDTSNLTATSSVVTVSARMVSGVILTATPSAVFLSTPVLLKATVTSPTSTVPTGTVTFFDGLASLGAASITAGQASITYAFTSVAVHNITAVYSGDNNFFNSTSAVAAVTAEDFTIANVSTANSASVLPGASASYTLNVTPVGGSTFPAAITFAVTGLPVNATYSLVPPTIAAGATATPVKLTINVPALATLHTPARPFADRLSPIAFGLLLLPFFSRRNRKRLTPLLAVIVLAGSTLGLSGCLSDQASGYFGQSPKTYTVTITATSGILAHSTTVTLTVQ